MENTIKLHATAHGNILHQLTTSVPVVSRYFGVLADKCERVCAHIKFDNSNENFQ